MRTILTSVVLSLTAFPLVSQTPRPAAPAAPGAHASPLQLDSPRPARKLPDYSAESAVIERLDSVYTFNADGTGTRERTMALRIQSDAALKQLGVVSIPYAGTSERVEFVYARVRRPDGALVETPSADAIDMPAPVTREAPLYSDLKEKQLPIKSLRVGDTLEWKVRIVRTKAEAPGDFWGLDSFLTEGVVLAQSIELRVPKASAVNVWSPTAKPVETTDATQRIYRWESAQLKPSSGKEADAEKEAEKKRIWTAEQELDADQGKLPTVAWTTFKSWQAVGDWYRSLEAERIRPDAEIKAKAVELTAGKSTDEEKVLALYNYVATQMRYIGVDFGIGRYQPHTASEILQNQFGDCKDKHTLLAALLEAIGIHADAVLIGVNIRFNEAVPSPLAFNHLITHLTVTGQPVWLDTTAEIAPYRMLFLQIRDKQALVVPAMGEAHLDRTPADPPFPSVQTMNAVGSLDKNGTSNSRLTLTSRGDDELVIRSALRQVAPAQYDQLVQQISYGMGYAGTTSNPEISRPEDTNAPIKLSYDYKREKAGDWDNYRIIPQVAPVSLPRLNENEPPVRSLLLGVPRVETSTSAMKLPEGWGAELPETVHARCEYASYDETYRLDNGMVYADRRIEVFKSKVPVSDLKTYKKWSTEVGLGNENYIQLTRTCSAQGTCISRKPEAGKPEAEKPKTNTASAAPDDGPPIASETGAEAMRLLKGAYASIQQRELDTAATQLEQVKEINPEQPGLYAMYGLLALGRSKPTDAVDDFHKELKLHPDNFGVYAPLVEAQLRIAHREDALDSLRAWSKANSSDPIPVMRLMGMLVEDGNAAEAAKIGEAALPGLSEEGRKNEPFQIALGTAQLKAAKKEEGRATLRAVLQQTDSAESLNDAAYALADASIDLPLDDASTRAALDKLTTESNGWTLDDKVQTLRAKTHLIGAAWDTLGWTLYREGKLQEAQSYLDAAWHAEPSAVVAQHLGELALARGNKPAAMAAFELALAKAITYDEMGVSRPPGPLQKELQKRVDTLTHSGVKSTIGTAADPYKMINSENKIPLGPSEGLTRTAEYRALIRNGKVVKVEPTSGKTIDGLDAMFAKAKLSAFFPIGSQATLFRLGYLNCHSGVCEFVLEP